MSTLQPESRSCSWLRNIPRCGFCVSLYQLRGTCVVSTCGCRARGCKCACHSLCVGPSDNTALSPRPYCCPSPSIQSPAAYRTASSSQDITQLFAFLKPSPLGRPDCAAGHLRERGVSTSLCLLTFLYCPDFTPHPTPLRLLAAKASVSGENQGGGAFVSGCTDPLSAGGLVLTSVFHGAE